MSIDDLDLASSDAGGDGAPREAAPVNPITTSLAAGFAGAAAAWLVAGIFRDFGAHYVALAGVLIGVVPVILSYRFRGGAVLRYLSTPVALFAGAALVAPDARGGTATFVNLVVDALKTGGLLEPPVSFEPGWRFLLLVLFAFITGGAASIGVTLGRPKLAVAVPVPLLLWATVVQPHTGEIPAVAIAFVLLGIALSLAFGAELSSDGRLSAGFELRRMGRGAAMAGALAVAVLIVSQATFLFPQPNRSHVIPPQKPPNPPAQPDRLLFMYTSTRAVPLRLGVIDTYDVAQHAWLLPPYDVTRFKRLEAPTRIPGGPPTDRDGALKVDITVVDATGHGMPAVAGLGQVTNVHEAITFDPRTNAISLADKPLYTGFHYTVIGAPIPTGTELAKAGDPPPDYRQYLAAPTPPNEVNAAIADFSQRATRLGVPEDGFNRLTSLRQLLYDKVIAAGPGTPTDITSPRVAQMLQGGEASPYEITAAEALIARWAGVPSRIGYGYQGGEPQPDGSFGIHPQHAAMWLEVYFKGYGWQPLVGVPPKAKPSIRPQPKNQLNIASSNDLDLAVYIPVRYPSVTLAFEYVRYFLVRVLPVVLLLVLVAVAYPYGLKRWRRRRRLRWGRAHGYPGRIAVAYAEFRDLARDLAVGPPGISPVKFLPYTIPDDEHAELAWLVTRALWGDLRRDLRPEDAVAAEQMAASLSKRLDKGQPTLNRILARIARTSLREPYSTQMPNPWIEFGALLHPFSAAGRRLRRTGRRRRPGRGRLAVVGTAVGLLPWILGGCGSQAAAKPRILAPNIAPAAIPAARGGYFTFVAEPGASKLFKKAGGDALVSDGTVFRVEQGGVTYGTFEVSIFKDSVSTDDLVDSNNSKCVDSPAECPGHEVLAGLQSQLGSGQFHRIYYGSGNRAYEMVLPDQHIYLWFPPKAQTMCVLTLLSRMPDLTQRSMFRYVAGYELGDRVAPSPLPILDPTIAEALAAPVAPGIPTPGPTPSVSPSPAPLSSPTPNPGGTP